MAIVVVYVAALLISVDGYGEPKSPTKQEGIKKLLELTGSVKLRVQVMNQMITSFKRGNSRIPDKFWEEFMTEIDANERVEMVMPIYEKYLTHGEIRELIKFYESPLGKKLIEVQPKIVQESMIAGQEWGWQIGEKVTRKLKEQGYK